MCSACRSAPSCRACRAAARCCSARWKVKPGGRSPMDCNVTRSLLEAYLDKELDRAEARELEAHLDGCSECRAELTKLDELRVALRDRALRYAAPAALRER